MLFQVNVVAQENKKAIKVESKHPVTATSSAPRK
jgi:hypothetical protein